MSAVTGLDDLIDHLLQCHSVDPESEAMRFALKTIEDVRQQGKAVDKNLGTIENPTNHLSDHSSLYTGINNNSKSSRNSSSTRNGQAACTLKELPMPTAKRYSIWTIIFATIRFVLVEFPLVLLFALGVSSFLFSHVYDNYWDPQFDLMTYTDENRTADLTYYHRQCTPDDISTQNLEDLYIYEDFTTQEKVEHILTHGMSVYQNILSDETATNLRSWILERNKALNTKDEIDVISNENRWSFYIGANDDPLVSKALNEVATHEVFRPALEKIVGRNPAIIEMTAITSGYGAADQFWHHDIMPEGSPAKVARSFIPSYSLFMTLQDTSATMGATDLCPGTHMCGSSDAESVCVGNSFQASGDGYWKGGDALFMNQQNFHRGAAHSDPNGPHRALFIVTFAPRPMDMLYETRMLGTGGSYSLRWDMWGHTLDDFEHATTKMRQPWAALRGLGLYKPKDSDWGWDWVAETSMRIANGDTGYYDENLHDFVSRGGLGLSKLFTPTLQEDMSWRDYCAESVKLWKALIVKANIVGYVLYMFLSLMISIALLIAGKRTASRNTPLRNAFRSIGRVAMLDAVVVAIAAYILHSTNQSSWAKAIRSKTLYTSPFPVVKSLIDPRPLAVVSQSDVLLTDRYDVKYLGSLADIVEFQGGNTKYRSTLKGASKMAKHLNAEDVGRLANNILDGMKREGSRLLFQNDFTNWVVLSDSDSVDYTTQAIFLEANPLVAAVHKESRFLLSSYKHGLKYRYSGALARKHSIINIHSVLNKLMENSGVPLVSLYTVPTLLRTKTVRDVKSTVKKAALKLPRFAVFRPREKTKGKDFVKRMVQSLPANVNTSDEGMFQIGDVVDAQYNGMFNEYYKGKIISISQGSLVNVQYFDGEIDPGLAPHHLKKFIPYAVGEIVEVKTSADSNGLFHRAELLNVVLHNGKVIAKLFHNKRIVNVKESSIRRVKDAEPGDVVECPFQGSEELFRGTVVKRNADGTYHVKFFDGDVDYHVEPSDVLVLE